MENKKVIIVVVLFAVVIIGMFVFAFLKRGELKEPEVVITPEPVVTYPSVDRITAKHFYVNDIHTFAGEIALPTPCDLLDTQVGPIAESFPEQVTLQFDIINNSEVCLQQITSQRFKIDVEGVSEDAVFSARFIDRSVPLNLIEAEEGESPDDFELFIKG